MQALPIPEVYKQTITFINATITQVEEPFYYIKNLLQLTLFAYVLNNLLSIWIISSLYYFIPYSPFFVKYVLLVMWKSYNISFLAIFNIDSPQLPQLNYQESTQVYGDIVISNDFLNFTFDSLLMLAITFTYFVIFSLFKNFIKCAFFEKSKLKLSFLKI